MYPLINNFFLRFFLWFVDYIFPSKCVNCGVPIPFSQNCLCDPCINKIVFVKEKCDICSGNVIDGRCIICFDRKLFISKNITLAEYSGVMKEILHNFKFKKRKRLFIHLARFAYNQVKKQEVTIDIITAVPMSRSKRWNRGFNQSELIAKGLAKKMNKKYKQLLTERIRSGTQKKLKFIDRFLNILDRFKVKNASLVKGKRILIIDDVFTTGATINECARVLRIGGAKEVLAFTVARATIKRLENL